jgi:hypothetical protein
MRDLLFIDLEGENFKIEMPTDSVPGEGSLSGFWTAVFSMYS